MAKHQIVQGQTARPFRDQLTFADGSIPNLTGSTVFLSWRNIKDAQASLLLATIVDPVEALVEYFPADADVAVPGDYEARWKEVKPGGKPQYFPEDRPILVKILPNRES